MSGYEHAGMLAARMIAESQVPVSGIDDDELNFIEPFLALTLLIPATPVPDDLEARVASSCSDTVADTDSDADAALVETTTRPPWWLRLLRATVPTPIIALVLMAMVLVGSLALNAAALRDRGLRPIDILYASGTPAAEGARAVALTDGRRIVLFATGMAELADGYHYVAWDVTGDIPTRLGRLVRVSGANARLTVDRGRLPRRFEVTIESGPRPSRPSGPVVLAGMADSR